MPYGQSSVVERNSNVAHYEKKSQKQFNCVNKLLMYTHSNTEIADFPLLTFKRKK